MEFKYNFFPTGFAIVYDCKSSLQKHILLHSTERIVYSSVEASCWLSQMRVVSIPSAEWQNLSFWCPREINRRWQWDYHLYLRMSLCKKLYCHVIYSWIRVKIEESVARTSYHIARKYCSLNFWSLIRLWEFRAAQLFEQTPAFIVR